MNKSTKNNLKEVLWTMVYSFFSILGLAILVISAIVFLGD